MKEIILTNQAPAPIGPYSQAIKAGDFLFISGQIPIDPETGELVTGQIDLETRKVMENLEAILKNADYTFENVVKASIFLSDMALFNAVNQVYGEYFNMEAAPARETVAVKTLPKNVNVEISLIAYKKQV